METTHTLKVEVYDKMSINVKVDYKTGIDLCLQLTKQLETFCTRHSSVGGPINHMDFYHDLYNEGHVKLDPICKT